MVKKWPTVQTAPATLFDMNSPSKPDLDDIDWKTAVMAQKSSSGAMGVYYVGFSDGTAVVVKGSGSTGTELFCTKLIRLLNVCSVPDIRVYKRLTDVGSQIYSKVVSLEMGLSRQGLAREYLTVMEYCSGCNTLNSIGDFNISSSCLGQLGRLAVFDMLLRNTDRFPLVVDNRGNPGNVLIRKADTEVFAIDNSAACIDLSQHKDRAIEYVRAVAVYIRDLDSLEKRGELSKTPLKTTAIIRDQILEYSAVDIGIQGTIDVQVGAWGMIIEMYYTPCLLLETLLIHYRDSLSIDMIIREFEKLPDSISGLSGINLPFIELLLSVFHLRGNCGL